jgi:hypothetical protein
LSFFCTERPCFFLGGGGLLKLLLLSLEHIGQFSTRKLSRVLSSVATDVISKTCLYFNSDPIVNHNRVHVLPHLLKPPPNQGERSEVGQGQFLPSGRETRYVGMEAELLPRADRVSFDVRTTQAMYCIRTSYARSVPCPAQYCHTKVLLNTSYIYIYIVL